MSNQFQDQLNLLQKVAAIAKASTQWGPDPDDYDDDVGLDDYLGGLVDPDAPAADSTATHALRDSTMIGLHLAKARVGLLKDDSMQVHRELNKAMSLHSRLHAHINATAGRSEMNPMRIREEQED
jgi:hypothetical protein